MDSSSYYLCLENSKKKSEIGPIWTISGVRVLRTPPREITTFQYPGVDRVNYKWQGLTGKINTKQLTPVVSNYKFPKKIIRSNKQKKILKRLQPFECSNQFNLLQVEQEILETSLEQERESKTSLMSSYGILNSSKFSKRKQKTTQKMKPKSKTIKDISLLEGDRCFAMSIKKEEENLKKNINGGLILNVPKKCLKKCRSCNYKKRTCALNPWSCKAQNLICYKCSRYGHFPRSMNCKGGRKNLKLSKEKYNNFKENNKMHKKSTGGSSTSFKCDEIRQSNEIKCGIHIFQVDGNIDEDFSKDDSSLNEICQFDGSDDILEKGESQLIKGVFAVNCEVKEIIPLISFFRSLNILWIETQDHSLCHLERNCFLCNMRSSCL